MTPSDIEQIYEEFHTPKHVRQHCLQVALVGEFLANALNEAGMEIDASRSASAILRPVMARATASRTCAR